MKLQKILKVGIGILVIIILLVWSPWITDKCAVNKVVEKLGGPETRFNYLGRDMAVKDIPKNVVWLPFVRAVYFPGEAVWFVTFYDCILFEEEGHNSFHN